MNLKLTSIELTHLIQRGLVKIHVDPETEHRDYMRQWREKRRQREGRIHRIPAEIAMVKG